MRFALLTPHSLLKAQCDTQTHTLRTDRSVSPLKKNLENLIASSKKLLTQNQQTTPQDPPPYTVGCNIEIISPTHDHPPKPSPSLPCALDKIVEQKNKKI